jgi:hypothetical protein
MYVLPTSIVVNNNIKSKYKTLINDEKIKKNIELDNNHISKNDINNKKNTEFNKRRLN